MGCYIATGSRRLSSSPNLGHYAHTFACFYLQARIVEKRDVPEGSRDVVKGNERQLRERKL
jgi:hypothetical protein